MGAFVNFGADYLEPGVIHFGGRGAVVLGETDGEISQRVQALRAALLAFEEDAHSDGQHLRLSVEQGSLRRDALCHGPDE